MFQDQVVTYEEMNSLADRLAIALLANGLQKGDRVGLVLPNLPQFVLAFYGVLKAGGVVVAINPLYKQSELVYQIFDSGTEILIGLGSAYGLLKAVQKETALRTLILTNPEDGFALPGWASGKREEYPAHFPLDEGDAWLNNFISSHPRLWTE